MNSMRGVAPAVAPKRACLHVENLSPQVTESMLRQMFAVAGPVQHVKIRSDPDRNTRHDGPNYGLVEYRDTGAAEIAIQTLNGRKVFYNEIRVRWAYPEQGQQNKKDNPNQFRVFVGDLSPEVNDDVLDNAFSTFGTLSHARVIRDVMGKSRGYGIVVFRHKTDAEQAIAIINGAWLGSRAIRVSWANQKTHGGPSSSSVGSPMGGSDTAPAPVNYISVARANQRSQGGPSSSSVGSPMGGGDTAPAPVNFISVDRADQRTQSSSVGSPMGSDTAPAPVNFISAPLSYETVVQQTPTDVTTVCVDNLDPHCTSVDLIPLFQTIGYLSDIHNRVDHGFTLIKMDTHEHAALAIFRLQGHIVHGRPIRCSWGVERAGDPLSYEAILEQMPADVTTVRVVNLVPYCTQADLIPLFKPIGHFSQIHVDADRGFGSVKLDTHQRAAMAIVQLQGRMVHGRPIGCSWGVEAAGDPSAMW